MKASDVCVRNRNFTKASIGPLFECHVGDIRLEVLALLLRINLMFADINEKISSGDLLTVTTTVNNKNYVSLWKCIRKIHFI
jgi:hypothetical protein